MKKIKIGLSFFVLILFCLISNNFLLLINYFLALIFHEMGHLIVACSKGYNLKKIKLDMFGMTIDLDSTIEEKDNFAINIAGPICNLFICLCCLAFYWLVPISFLYLNVFCVANLVLAIFNLLPIYPLDGGKIFTKIFSKNRTAKLANRLMKIILVSIFILLGVFNVYGNRIVFFAVAIFFVFPVSSPMPSFVIMKSQKSKKVQKIELIKIDKDTTVLSLLKLMNTKKYTIFYCAELKKQYIDEDDILKFASVYELTSSVKNCVKELENH